ncbi:MAG: hypothetical protein JNJ54_11010 [Myxococcaceae bacterium]|nr:hypothetical protein [Myxococcaceae bacterium]
MLIALVLSQTLINHPPAADQLMGDHVFNLQWIDSPPGVARVSEPEKGQLQLDAEQRNKKGDLASIKGRITRVDAWSFELKGTITTQVSYVNSGKPCTREGDFTFRITGKRKYWRLKQMQNCDGSVDYLDIFFARPPSPARTDIDSSSPQR